MDDGSLNEIHSHSRSFDFVKLAAMFDGFR